MPSVEYITHHILFQLLRDSSAALGGQHDGQRNHLFPMALLLRWFVWCWGVASGGMVVYGADYAIGKLLQYGGGWLVGAFSAVVVVGGPDLGPPATLCNGLESLSLRVAVSGGTLLSGLFVFGWKNTQRDVWILSALWHMTEANGEFHKIARHSSARLREDRASQEEASHITKMLMLQFFRLGAGIGIVLAVFGVYSLTNFLRGVALIAFLILAPQVLLKLRGVR